MKFNDKYELLDLLASDAESVTFKAVEMATARDVLVHILSGPDIPADLLPKLSSESVAKVLETARHNEKSYVVTSVAAGVSSLRAALRSAAPAARDKDPGEFTRMFGGKAPFSRKTLEDSPPPPAPHVERRTESRPRTQNRDEGTDGEFTVLFHKPAAPSSPSPVRPEPPPQGDWAPKLKWDQAESRVESRVESTSDAIMPPSVGRERPVDAPASGPSEFTRVSSRRPVSQPAAEIVNPAPPQSEALTPPPALPSAPSPTLPTLPPKPQLPSIPKPESLKPAAAPSDLPLILVLGALLLLAVIVVIYFAVTG